MIGLLNQLEVKAPVVFRLDGGNDTRETLKVLDTSGHFFVVKRNLRTEALEYWLSVALSEGEVTYKVIGLYRDHRTSEQFHSELKSDMNVERLPSGKFAVNAIILQVAMVAFNTLRFIGQSAIDMEELPYKTGVIRKRLRKVIDDLIRI